jgi:5,10-methylenetetrahydromethanopterin reductase
MAAAALSVHQASGGRMTLGIGRGDSALAYVGLSPAPVSYLERYVSVLRLYLTGKSIPVDVAASFVQGARSVEELALADRPNESGLQWLDPKLDPVPVDVAASGPRVIEVAARVADRLTLTLGAGVERVAWGIDVAQQVKERQVDSPLRFGTYLNVVPHSDLDTARDIAVHAVATFARFSVMGGSPAGPISARQRGVYDALTDAYDMNRHLDGHKVRSGVITSQFLDEFAILGSTEDCISRLSELGRLGIDRFTIICGTAGSDAKESARSYKLLVDEVIPAVRAELAH